MQITFKTETTCSFLIRNSFHQSVAFGREPKVSFVVYKQVVRAQTTLTGVQAKLSLDVNPGGKNEPDRFTIVGLWGKFILKPQTDFYRALPELEDLTMHMAEAAKIAVVPHGLVRFADGELGYITRRIDRRPDG